MSDENRSHALQVVGSLLAAALIVAAVVIAVTAKIGPGPDGQEQRDRYESQEERQGELQEQREERLEERAERREG